MIEMWGRLAATARLMTAMAMIAATVAIGHAQPRAIDGAAVDADPSDVVRGRVRPVGAGRFFIGEPVVLRFTISNHARQKLGIQTNFIPQSNLAIDIIPEGESARTYTGPYPPGRYPVIVFTLMPFDEFSEDVMIWSDPSRPSGLAFDKPGKYQIQPSLMVEIVETKRVGKIPLGAPITVRIVDTPPQLKPMIQRLAELKAFEKLQQRLLPPEAAVEIEKLVNTNPPNPVSPYIWYALANSYTFVTRDHPERYKEAFDRAITYYQQAAQSDSALKIPIYLDMLRFVDHEKKSKLATQLCRKLLSDLPQDARGKIGGLGQLDPRMKNAVFFPQLLKKYLVNTPELERAKYWQVLN